MKMALVSLDQIWENKQANLKKCEAYIQKANYLNVELIVFPEMTLTGFSTNIDILSENEDDSFTIKTFQYMAEKYEISIHFGVIIEDNNKALNKSFFVNNRGHIIGNYSKIHPFSFASEDRYFNAGNALSIFDFNGYKMGLTICYDLRFPELYSAMEEKCDIIFNIANWPEKRVEHWETLLKARAIENQLYIVGVNRIGIDGNSLKYVESSNIYNAEGKKLEYQTHDSMKIFDVHKNWTDIFKKKFMTTQDRKTSLYKELL